MTPLLSTELSPTDWIRIFASRLARRRPNVSAQEVLALAIDRFGRCHSLAPEIAAEQIDDEPPSAADGLETSATTSFG